MNYEEREDAAERRARALVDLVRPRLPVEVRVGGAADAWPLVGPGLIARQVGAVEAIFAIRPLEREADAIVMLRSLYDHSVTFAWLAADPGVDRHRCFLKSDSSARLKADDDCRKVGVPILLDEKRAEYQRQVDELPAVMPPLLDRAVDADEHWTGRIAGLRGADTTHSYRGLYAIAYRRHSAYDHASVMGLNAVTVDLPRGGQRVQLEERESESYGVFGLTTILFAFTLFIGAQTLGWPDRAAAEAAFE
jgi:hypothetical protein